MIFTPEQKRLADDYMNSTGFDLMECDAPTDRVMTDAEFFDMFERNLRWFRDWSDEVYESLDHEFRNFRRI